MGIALSDTAEPQQTIAVAAPETRVTAPQLPEDVLTSRSDKAAWATSTPYPQMYSTLASGQEENFRGEVSAQRNEKTDSDFRDILYKASQNKGRPLTTDEMGGVFDAWDRNKKFNRPAAVFENALSEKYINTLYDFASESKGSSWYDGLLKQFPQQEKIITNLGESFIGKQSYLQTVRENVQSKYNQQSWPAYLWDQTKDFVLSGFPTSAVERGNVPGVGYFDGLLPTNIESQRIALHRMDTPEFQETVDKAIKYMLDKEHNPSVALDWIDKMLGKSDSYTDYAKSLVGVVGGVAGTLSMSPATKAIELLANMSKAAVSKTPQTIAAPAAVGNLAQAATAQVVHNMTDRSSPVEKQLTHLYDALKVHKQELLADVPANYVELSNRLADEVDALMMNLDVNLKGTVKVNRVQELLKTPEGVDVVRKMIENKYGSERVLNIGEPVWDPRSNSLWVETRLGRHDGTYWVDDGSHAGGVARQLGLLLKGSENMPRQFELESLIADTEKGLAGQRRVLKLGTAPFQDKIQANIATLEKAWQGYHSELMDLRQSPGAQVRNDGLGHYISVWDSVNQTDPLVRGLSLKTTESRSPETGFLGASKLRTSGETFSKDLFDNARVTTYAPAVLSRIIEDDLKAVKQASSWTIPGTKRAERWNRLEEVMDAAKQERNPITGELGYIFKNVGELQNHYLKSFHEPADPQTVKAYFAWSRSKVTEASLNSLRKFSNEANMGAKMHRLRMLDENRQTTYSNFFEGVEQPHWPSTSENIAVSVAGKQGLTIRPPSQFKGKIEQTLKDGVEQGRFKVIKLLYPQDTPLAGFKNINSENIIQYVIHPAVETKPLQVTNSLYRPWEYNAPWSIKQAILKHDIKSGLTYYLGDRTIMHMYHPTTGRDMTNVMENTRKLIGEGKETEAQAYTQAQKLPIDWSQHSNWYESGYLRTGITVDAGRKVEMPIMLVPRGKRTIDLDNTMRNLVNDESKFKDTSLSPHMRGEPDVHEIFTVTNKGTKHDPLYSYEPSPRISVMSSVNRSLNRIVNSTYLDDFKATAIEHWIAEAKNYLQYKNSPSEIDHSSQHFFYNGQFRDGTPLDIRSRLEGNRYKIKQILGTPSPTDTFLQQMSQKMYDSSFEKENKALLAPAWLLPRIPDAAAALRSAAYHAVMGWSIPQMLVQNMNYATIMGLAGYKLAGQGSAAGLLHQFSRMNNNWIPHFDKALTAFGWKPGEFTEANRLLQGSGFQYIGKEHIINEGLYNAKVISNGANKFLDASGVFFNSAERNQRFAAWYTSYKEYREAHPTGPIGNDGYAAILGRADTLAGEMSSASKSIVQKGPLAFTTQFGGYSMRMMELMMGHRLDAATRTRMMYTYAALFGAGGLGITGLPLGDSLRKAATDAGYNPGEHFIQTALMEGIPSYLLHMATGNWYNVGGRYASLGIDQIRDMLNGDKKMWEIAGGASWNMLSTAWESGDPLRQSVMSIIRNDDAKHPMKLEDFSEILKTYGAYSHGVQTLAALNTRNWISKKGNMLDKDVSPLNAFFMSASGLQELESSQTLRATQQLSQDKKTLDQVTEKRFMYEYRKAIEAQRNNSTKDFEDYMSRARAVLIVGGYPTEEYPKVFGEAARSTMGTEIEKAREHLYLKHRPAGKAGEERRLQYLKIKELEGK